MKNAFNRNVSNDNLRIRYYRKYKEYKKLVKYKRRKYRENLTYMLNETMEHNPQAAWKIINELKNDSLPPDKSEKINRTQWYSHFKDLLHSNTGQIDNVRQEQIQNELNQFEALNKLGNLDYDITEKEILNASKKLKKQQSKCI